MAAAQEKLGAIKTGVARSNETFAPLKPWVNATNTIATNSVAGTAYNASQRRAIKYVANITSTNGSAVCAAKKPCKPKRASTPASNAEAMPIGMRFITRSNQPVAPLIAISAALTIKAPTASFIVNPPASPAVANTAAPGVLHATITGFLSHNEGSNEHKPIPKPNAHIHEVMISGVALNASAAWKTMATELVKPTSTATKPAVKADGLRSLKNCMGRIVARK